jgi:hypothetical protein
MALGQAPAIAATIHVGKTCTLVRAIIAANNDTIATGHCAKGNGADTLVLSSGSPPPVAAVNNTIYRDAGLPVIRDVITINGNGSTIRRRGGDASDNFRIFVVGETSNLTLQRTTISGGRACPDH